MEPIKNLIPKALREIALKFLIKHDYDGLYRPGKCACKIDNLIPCSLVHRSCKPGYIVNPNYRGNNFYIGSNRKLKGKEGWGKKQEKLIS